MRERQGGGGAWGIIRDRGSERPKYEREIIIIIETVRGRERERRQSGAAWTCYMLTPFVCVPVHFIKPLTLNRFSGSSQSHGVIMLLEML